MIFRCGFRAVVIYFFGVYFCDFDHLVIKFVRVENARDNKTFVYRALNLFKCLFPLLILIFPIESKVQSALSDKNCSRDSQPTTWNLFLTMMRLVNYKYPFHFNQTIFSNNDNHFVLADRSDRLTD